jgi:hypothetical protein
MNRAKKIRRHNPASMMTTFWPGIRKQKIEPFNRLGRQQITHCIETFYPQQPHIVQRGGFAGRCAHSVEQPFDPEKILVWHPLRQCAKKRTVAAPKIDVQRRFASENLIEIQMIRKRFDCNQPKRDVPAVS